MFCTFLEELLAMFFFLQEFKANKDSRETAPLKLPVDGLALFLPEPEDQRHPVRTCRWRYIARQPWLWQQTKSKLHFLQQYHILQSSKPKARRFLLYRFVCQILVSFTSIEQSKRDECPTKTYLHLKHKNGLCPLSRNLRI